MIGKSAGESSRGQRRKSRTRGRVVAEPLEHRRLLAVVAHFFNSPDWSGPVAQTQYSYDVNFNWGVNSPDAGVTNYGYASPIQAVRNDGFSSAFTGQIYAPTTGAYTFLTQTDDDGFLFVNGRLVSQDPGSHALRLAPSHSAITLGGGTFNDFIFYQRDRSGTSGAILDWVPPGETTPQLVPGYDMSSFSRYEFTPAAPTHLAVTASSPLGVSLQWTGDTYAERYEIERSTDGVSFSLLATTGLVSGTPNGTGVLTRYTDASVSPGQSYYYRVRAANFYSDTDPSNTVSTITPALTATSGVEAHFYNQPLWGGPPQWGTVAPNINMQLASGASPGPSIQTRDFSSIFTGKLSITTPGIYTLFSSTDDDGYLYLDGALVSLDPGTHGARNPANFTPVFLGAGAHDVVLEQSQFVNIAAATLLYGGPDTGGTLTVAPTSALTPLSDVPATPTGLSVTSFTSDSVTLQWQDNSVSETDYLVERSTDGVTFTPAGHAGIVANPSPGVAGLATYVDSVDPGTQYTYRVRAINFDGQSSSATVQVTTPSRTVTDLFNYASGFTADGGLLLDGYKSFDSPHPSFNSPPSITTDGRLRLTDDQAGEARAAFTSQRVPIDVFTTSFVYQAGFDVLPPDNTSTLFADGITFTIQNYNPGQKGVGYNVSGGQGGQGLGYAGTPNSVSVKLDIFQSPGDPSSSSTGVYTAGSTPLGGEDLLPSGVNLHSGHPIAVTISYRQDSGQLTTTLTDTVTHATATEYDYLDIPAQVGGDWAYVGFTGATGGGHSTQDVLSWNYSGRLGPPVLFSTFNYGTYGSMPGFLSAELEYNGPIAGEAVDFNFNGIDIGTAVTDANGIATLPYAALAQLDAGYYPLTLSTAGDNLYVGTTDYTYLYVNQQYALVQYTGMTLVTANAAGVATFSLRSVLSDTSGGTGDIRNANVYYNIYGSDGSYAFVNGGPVSLLNSADNKTGVSTTTWTANLNGAPSVTYSVYPFVGFDYFGSTYASVTVSMPSVGQVSGGGSVVMNNSAGLYAADASSLLNFDLTARNLSGDAKGNLTITYVRTDSNNKKHTYQIASTAVNSYGSDHSANLADIQATATLTDITDPLHPLLIASGLELDVTLTDRGSPGANDSIAFTLWGGSTLYFSSDWTGTGTQEDKLKNGNLVVH